MTDIGDIGQKIKGKSQQVKGELEQQSGQGIKGGYTKLKGKLNETIANAKMNTEDEPEKL